MDFQEDESDMCEKILKQIQNIIMEDDYLLEFSLIPTDSSNVDKNVSPVKYIVDEHCLGLETWCARLVFKYALVCIFKLRRKLKPACKDFAQTMNRYVMGALLVQPEVTTLWNIKRELVMHSSLDVQDEYKFTRLVLSTKKKCFEAFTYRTFLYKFNKAMNPQELLLQEQAVLANACNMPNNYHAWNHRIWCYENIIKPNLPKQVQLDELHFSETWVSTHVSEHSGFHYRQYLLQQFKNTILFPKERLRNFLRDPNTTYYMMDREWIKQDEHTEQLYLQYIGLLILELFNVLPDIQKRYPGHESVWYHRRFAMQQIIEAICSFNRIKVEKPKELLVPTLSADVNVVDSAVDVSFYCNNYTFRALESSELYKMLLKQEREQLDELLSVNHSDAVEVDLLRRYEKWLRCIMCMNL